MSTFNNGGRRAPNVSQYLANLNTIPTSQEVTAQQNDFGNLGDDLDFLTNTEFFDFDNFNGNVDFPQPVLQPEMPQQAVMPPHQQKAQGSGMGMNGPQYQFGEFQTYPIAPNNSLPPSPPNGLQGPFPQQAHAFSSPPNTGDKRKASTAAMQSPADLEESARYAAEEDKRRRNTAASARFRVKKKQREQELEKRTKEMNEKVALLEDKVQQLEMENKWLKGLITEKSGGELPMRKGSDAGKDTEERSTEKKTEGVGTAAEATEEREPATET